MSPSPRAKSAGPKGLHAESASDLLADGALTVGRGETFWRVGRVFLTKMAVFRAWNPGSYCKNRIFGPKSEFFDQKRALLDSNHVPATTGQSCAKKKVRFSQINISPLAYFGCFLPIFVFFCLFCPFCLFLSFFCLFLSFFLSYLSQLSCLVVRM